MEVLTSRTIIHPSDLDRSLAFYGETLGLAVARQFGEGDQRGTVFFAGNGLIEVSGGGNRPDIPAPDTAQPAGGPVILWLQVRDLQSTLVELSHRGAMPARPAVLEPWGLIEAWLDDPDGLRIHVVEVPAGHPLRQDSRPPEATG